MSDELIPSLDFEIDSNSDSDDSELFELISVQQMKYVDLVINSTLDENQIAALLNIESKQISKWKKDPIVIKYMTMKKKKYEKINAEQAAVQSKILNDLAFAEMLGRFQVTKEDQDIIDNADVPVTIRLQVMRKYAQGSTFRDVLEATKVLGKQHRDDLLGDHANEEDMMIETVRKTYQRKRHQREDLGNALQKAGLDSKKTWQELVTEDGGLTYTTNQQTDDEFLEELTHEVEIRTITKKNRREDNDE